MRFNYFCCYDKKIRFFISPDFSNISVRAGKMGFTKVH